MDAISHVEYRLLLKIEKASLEENNINESRINEINKILSGNADFSFSYDQYSAVSISFKIDKLDIITKKMNKKRDEIRRKIQNKEPRNNNQFENKIKLTRSKKSDIFLDETETESLRNSLEEEEKTN